MYEASLDPELNRMTGTHKTHSFEDVRKHCERLETSENRFDFALCLRGSPVGEIVLMDVDKHNQSAFLRMAIWQVEMRGYGYGQEALMRITEFAFDDLRLNRIELEVFDFNARARRLYERCGFKYEGLKRAALFWGNAFHNAHVMALLRGEQSDFRS